MLTGYPWFAPVTENLSQAYSKNRMSHGLLLVAPDQSGKLEYAKSLAASLLCRKSAQDSLNSACGECKNCQLLASGTHPDFYLVDRLVDNKGKQKQSIGIDQIRHLTQKLADTPQLGGWRIAIVASVTAMTTSAFNALLKTLEEPGKDTLLIMLANRIQQVPATIRSRCQIAQADLSPSLLADWLSSQTDASPAKVKHALKACYYAPLAAQGYLLEDGESDDKQLFRQLDRVLANQVTPDEFLQQSTAVVNLNAKLCDYLFQIATCLNQDSVPLQYEKLPAKSVFQLYQKLLDYQRAQNAGSNLQEKLQIQAILIQWFEIGRKIGHYSRS